MTFRDDITQAKQQKSTGDIIALVIRSTWPFGPIYDCMTLSQLNRKFTFTKGLSKNRELLSWSILNKRCKDTRFDQCQIHRRQSVKILSQTTTG